MALTAREVELIQSSFAKVEPIEDTAAAIFYKTLFQYDPNLKPLFKGDMKQQGRKLMTTLKLAVAGLDDLSALVPVLEQLAERHVGYGVRPGDYTTVGNALLSTLAEGLGDEFTPETRAAWVAVFRVISSTMKAQHERLIQAA